VCCGGAWDRAIAKIRPRQSLGWTRGTQCFARRFAGLRKRVFPEASQACLAVIALQDAAPGLETKKRQVALRQDAQLSKCMPPKDCRADDAALSRVERSLAPNWPWLPDELDLCVAEAECSPSSLSVLRPQSCGGFLQS
jgi:hypothetical protein